MTVHALIAVGFWSLGAQAPARLAVLDVKPQAGAPAPLAAGITESTVLEVRRQAPSFSVISTDELRNLLALQRQKQQLGCDTTACLAEIGGALGASQMITGTLTRFGALYVLALKRVDTVHARVLRESSERFAVGSEADVPDLVARLVHSLFRDFETVGGEPPPPDIFSAAEEEVSAPARSHALGWTLVASAVVCAVVAAVAWGNVASAGSSINAINAGNPQGVTAATAYGGLGRDQLWSGLAIGFSAGLVATGAGAGLAW